MTHDFQADIDAIARIAVVPQILDVVSRLTGMGFAAVARVTEDRWITCSVLDKINFGLQPGGELVVATTICDEIRASGEPVVIDHVAEDAQYCGHPTPAMYGFQSYISMPIVLADGSFFGTLCAIDPHPRSIKTPEIIGAFRLFADLIATHLQVAERLATSEQKLSTSQDNLESERALADLREQFIAVLGHDLRNPVAAIDSGLKVLGRRDLEPKAMEIVGMLQHTVLRMNDLIDDVLDFARGRLGGGIPLQHSGAVAIEPILTQVVEELRSSQPSRVIETRFEIDAAVAGDPARLGQLLSNLLANALSHGDPETPVSVDARTTGNSFALSVSNSGSPIPPDTLDHMFEPFYRGSGTRRTGLGLGLYIASEIARAHGGTLTVDSAAEQTRFTFRMPVGAG